MSLDRDKETPMQYAQRRANETGRAYIVTGYGHAWMDCPSNRKIADEIGESITVIKPQGVKP